MLLTIRKVKQFNCKPDKEMASYLHYNDWYDTNNNKEKERHDTPVSCNLMKEAKQVNVYIQKNC